METKDTLSRREWLSRAGCAVGGAVAMGALQACASDSGANSAADTGGDGGGDPIVQPSVADIPYTYQTLDVDDVQARAYNNYFAGGCCYGSFSGLMAHLADTVGAPFDAFPIDLAMFGGGGIAGYGSTCGAILGGAMAFSLVIPGTHRNAMIQDLFRWYEGFAFPEYLPVAGTAVKVDGALSTSVSHSNLCHASVTTWCTQEGVTPASDEKKERCARLTADVAGKVAAMLNDYLATGTFAGTAAIDPASAGCLSCHSASAAGPANVAAGMQCGSCHDGHM